MIVTRTPFRITLGGGGTDLPSFYSKHGGYILAIGIDKFMYVALNVPYADRKVRLHYTQSEVVDHVGELKHELAREGLLAHGIDDAIEVSSLADLPAGTGLGSSSCYLVGLLNGIRTYALRPASAVELAAEACQIELGVLHKPIGKQDQYMAAFGGLTELRIARDGTVNVERIELPGYALTEFLSKAHMYYTNVQRSTIDILAEQTSAMRSGPSKVEECLIRIKEIGETIGKAIRAFDFDRVGELMHDHWLAKCEMSDRVGIPGIDALYDYVRREYGVLGGKIVGAGGGGFLMLYCPRDARALTSFMESQGMSRLPYNAEFEGSKVIVNVLTSRAERFHGGSLNPVVLGSPLPALGVADASR